jgi:DNA-binding beta-propeller fold protein YncE
MQTFKCPSCGGPTKYDGSDVPTVRCEFCGQHVIVPQHLLPIRNWTTPQQFPQTRVRTFSPLAILILLVVVIAGVVTFFVLSSWLVVTKPIAQPTPPSILKPSRPTTQQPEQKGFASVVMKFGGEGTGPGLFTDARSIAVDGEGHIYVADYTGGRVQVFDGEGKFITQWMVDAKMPLRGLTANRKGTVFVVQKGLISRYEGATGKPLGQLSYAEGWGFDDVVATPDGGLVAAWYKNRDDIIRFNSDGQATKTIRAAISSVTDSSELNTRIAVDGLGNIYAMGSFSDAVFKFTPEGKFKNKFGSDGDKPGQFRALQSIAVDNQSRVYVSDVQGIQVFDAEGRYLDTIKMHASGMVFNDRNELFVAARNQIFKLTINKP